MSSVGFDGPSVGFIEPGGDGGGVTEITSADGSVEWTDPDGPIADASVKAIGAETFIRTSAELNALAVGGLITINSGYTLTGIFTLDPGNHVFATVLGSITGTHHDNTGIVGDFNGPLVEGVVLSKFVIDNQNAGLLAEDLLMRDLSGRTMRVSRITPLGDRSGTIKDVAGLAETFDVVALGAGVRGFLCSDLVAGMRITSAGFGDVVAGYTNYAFDASVVVVEGLEMAVGVSVTANSSDRAMSFDTGMTIAPPAVIQLIGNVVTGPGEMLDQSPGMIDALDVRMVIKAGSTDPDFSVLAQAFFDDSITPILWTPGTADLNVFEVIPIQNVGPTTVIALTSSSHRVTLDVTDPADWWIQIDGQINDLLMDLSQAITVTKGGTTREANFKWFIQPQGVGPWAPLDITLVAQEVSTTKVQLYGSETVFVDAGDRLRIHGSSESTDTVIIASELFAAKVGG